MPSQTEPEASEKTSNWKCFSPFQGKDPDHESRKRQCSNSAFKSGETGIALGDLNAFDIKRQDTRENVNEFILPTNFCRDFKDTVLCK